MFFQPIRRMIQGAKGWLSANVPGASHSRPVRHKTYPRSSFRRLEKRRVFAVDAFFVAGSLSIEVTSVGETNANLLALGTDFFVDNNNNLAFEIGEIRGAIQDLRNVRAFSNESVGKLFWIGDFSSAPLATPLASGQVFLTQGLSEVHWNAQAKITGNVQLDAIDHVHFNGQANIQGNLAASTGPLGTISDGPNALLVVQGNANLQSTNNITIADETTSSWTIRGNFRGFSHSTLEVGIGGQFDADFIDLVAQNGIIQDQNDLVIRSIQAPGNVHIAAAGALSDSVGTIIDIDGSTRFEAARIVLANDLSDSISMDGPVAFVATSGTVTIASQGQVALGDISASGMNIEIFEDRSSRLAAIQTSGNFILQSDGNVTNALNSSVLANNLSIEATNFIQLAQNPGDVIQINGIVSLLSTTSSVSIASPGSVSLGDITASGTNITLFEDANASLATIQTPGSLVVTSSGSITDIAGANIQAATWNANAGTFILLADNTTDVMNISGDVSLVATAGSVTIASPGSVSLGNITASGTSITLFEDASTSLANFQTPGSLVVNSSGSITDIAGANIQAGTWNATAGTFILLADIATDVLNISGDVSLVATTGSVTIASPGSVSLGDITASGTSITLFEDTNTSLANIQTPGSLVVNSSGSITDIAGANIQAGTLNAIAGTFILLADNTTDVLNISGAVSLAATTGSVTIAGPGSVSLGDITASGTSITLFEDASTTIENIQTPGSLVVTSSGSITDIAGANIQSATWNATAGTFILLADNTTDVLNISGAVSLAATTGSVTIANPGSVSLGDITASGTSITLFEDANTTLANIQTPSSLVVTSSGSITDIAGANIRAATLNANAGTFILLADNATDALNILGAISLAATAGSVTIASPGSVSLGDITASGSSISLFEDANTTLASIQSPGSLVVTSSGSITDIAGANIQAATWNATAGTFILLADNATDVLNISGAVSLAATNGSVTIASPGSVSLGNITASGTSISLFEDASTSLANIQTPGSLVVISSGSITDIAGANIQAGTWNATAGTFILLADNATDVLNISGAVSLAATAGNVTIASPGSVSLGDITASGTSISLFEDANTSLANIQTPGSLVVNSSGSITDIAGANIQAGTLNATAGTFVLLADNATDILNITGAVSLTATAGTVTIASPGSVSLGDITASGTNITLFEDANTSLANIQTPGSLVVTSSGSITDIAGANIRAATLNANAGTFILLADNATDALNISGAVSLAATAGSVTIASPGSVSLGDITASGTNISLFEDANTSLANIQTPGSLVVNSSGSITDIAGANIQAGTLNATAGTFILLADNATDVLNISGAVSLAATTGSVTIASPGSVSLGNITASGTNITLFEDANTSLANIQTPGSLVVNSSGSITDIAGANIQAGTLNAIAGTFILLADNTTDVLNIAGAVSLAATTGSITIASPGSVSLGDITASGSSISLFEDANTSLANIQTPGSLVVNSSGSITDIAGANIQAGTLNANAGTFILLADNATDILSITGAVSFLATAGSVTIANPGSVSLGDITASGTSITLFEDANTSLANIQTPGSLVVNSSGSITDIAGANIQAGTLNATAGTFILLADNATDILNITGAVSLVATAGTVTIASPGSVSLGNITASGTSITLFEDANTSLANIQTPGSLVVNSSGSITDIAGANIQAGTWNATAGTSILLADNATDVLNISGAVSLVATAGSVTIASPGSVSLGDITASGTSITLFEDANTSLANIQTPGSLVVNSSGSITDIAGANIQAGTWNANAGTFILLADNATDVLNISGAVSLAATAGNVTIASPGAVSLGDITASGTNITLFEDANTSLANIQTPGSLVVTSSGSITDIAGANIQAATWNATAGTFILLADNATDVLIISGAVSLVSTAGSVTIANPGSVSLGDITASGTSITLFEDANTSLANVQTPGSLAVTSTGSITDIAGANIQAATWNATAGTFILLADNASDQVEILGKTLFTATGSIDISSSGIVNFGSVGFAGQAVSLSEDSGTHLDGSQVASLSIQSRDSITQSGLDTGVGTTVLLINGPLDLSLADSPGYVDLLRASSDPTLNTSVGRLLDNQIHGAVTADGINGNFALRNASGQARIGLLDGRFQDLTLWHTSNSIALVDQEYKVDGNFIAIAGVDVSVALPFANNPIDRILAPLATISDSSSRINVQGNANFVAAGSIVLSDLIDEQLRVSSGVTSLVSLGGSRILLGDSGTVVLSAVGASSSSISGGQKGDVELQLDSSVLLTNPTMPRPDSRILDFTTANLSLEVQGNLGTTPGTRMDIAGNLTGAADGSINIANSSLDILRVDGTTNLSSTSGSIRMGQSGTLQLQDVTWSANAGSIEVGGQGDTSLGLIEAYALQIFIQEDRDMLIAAAIAPNQVSLSSTNSIVNTQAYDPTGRQGIATHLLTLDVGTFAHIGTVSVDNLQASVQANGRLSENGLFVLNTLADRIGQSYLDSVNQNLPSGITVSEQLLSGETLTELRMRASFLQTFARDYGLFIQNDRQLTVQGIDSIGDGVRIYVETVGANDLVLEGAVVQQFTNQDPGGIVLIAGGQVVIGPQGGVQIQSAVSDASTVRSVLQAKLVASAFDAGQGPIGYQSTRDVLYSSDAFADSGTQNVLQRVSTQFGVATEAGFQTLIRYADGTSQLFDENQKLDASLRSGLPGSLRPGMIEAHVSTSGDAAVTERAIPFEDTFLGSQQTMPTTAIFRRSAEFFIFEQGGQSDAAVVRIDVIPIADPVNGVLSPGRKVSLPMTTEIVITPTILVEPIRDAILTPTNYLMNISDVEPSILSDAKFEVFIVKVGFDDSDRDGQPSDRELPPRSEIQIVKILESREENLNEASTETSTELSMTLKAGEPKMQTQEIKSNQVPTPNQIQSWIDEYRDDPSKPSGAYAVVLIDSVSGAKVLKVFAVRDFDIQSPQDQGSSVNDASPTPLQPITPEVDDQPIPKKAPLDENKSTSMMPTEDVLTKLTESEPDTQGGTALSLAAGSILIATKDQAQRFGKIARRIRKACLPGTGIPHE